MKLRYLLAVGLLSMLGACSKSHEATPPASTPAPAEATAAPVPDTSANAPAADDAETAPAPAEAAAPAPAPAPAETSAAAKKDGSAPAGSLVAGDDYVSISGGEPFDTGAGKVEVAEVFNYVCPACAGFNPMFQEWKKKLPAYVHVVYVPADFRPDFKAYARAYYAADALGLVDKTHEAVYAAIHEEHTLPGEGMTLDPAKIAAFYAKYGADPAQFQDLMSSFTVDAQVNKAHQFMMQSQVRQTPSLVIDGKYLVKGKTREDLLKNADQLIAREHAAQ
ncbi:thiol:disulfide interchange protein DsbA/DsbL [Solimonas terrae]|uniref:Thiol:disulfide interchange protein DsbA/DsbL n=1 Tax=Solimonas terrae TaxID=1396819 RepID=A0A6M2BTX6_9GAMM|nr:thiol:disulfide interchange protein DsbA/DsbL [Solimonas terrae]NGY05563.1 thiol:disulfide interchange protein DsbA/DsbL [Solimonas terrae]